MPRPKGEGDLRVGRLRVANSEREAVRLSLKPTTARVEYGLPNNGIGPWMARDVLGMRSTEAIMLYTLVVVLLVLWALGLATSYTLGGVLHLLLVVAVVLLAVQLLTGRRTV